MVAGAARDYDRRMVKSVSPKCPSCGAAISNPRLVKLPFQTYGSGWLTEAAPLAIGFQCANDGCGVLLPLTAYPAALQGKSAFRT